MLALGKLKEVYNKFPIPEVKDKSAAVTGRLQEIATNISTELAAQQPKEDPNKK